MVNLKQETLDHVKDTNRKPEYIKIGFRQSESKRTIEGPFSSVITDLDFEYDNGYGGQEIYGYIWYSDGTWSERKEYDGSEEWAHKKCPIKDVVLSF